MGLQAFEMITELSWAPMAHRVHSESTPELPHAGAVQDHAFVRRCLPVLVCREPPPSCGS